jgi:hypothetical protein
MKRRWNAALSILAVGIPGLALAGGLVRKPSGSMTLGRALAAAPRTASKIRPEVVYIDSTDAWEFLIPGAAAVHGLDGTYFHTDVTFANFRSAPQDIQVFWLAEGMDNTNAPEHDFEIPANSIVTDLDFVASELGETGLGALYVRATTPTGFGDPAAHIDASSRTWTVQPGSTGTVSLSYEPVSVPDSSGPVTSWTYGLRQDSAFRTNIGIVNLDSAPHTWTVGLNSGGATKTFTVAVPPLSLVQQAIPAGDYGSLGIGFQPDAAVLAWSAYAVSVDNTTGDGWVEHARQ